MKAAIFLPLRIRPLDNLAMLKAAWRALALLALASPAFAAADGAPAAAPIDKLSPEKILEVAKVYLRDLESEPASTAHSTGLKLSAAFLPDARAYRIVKEYVARRDKGEKHLEAVSGVAGLLSSLKQREGMAGVLVKIENGSPSTAVANTGAPPNRQIYTLQKEFVGEGLSLMNPEGKPIAARLAERPKNLRSTQLRIKKFWVTSDGATRRQRYDPADPASIGRKPKLSKPFPSIVIEEKPVEAELLFKMRPQKDPIPRVNLANLKGYLGPFQDDQLDLNLGRRWDPVDPLEVQPKAPPGGMAPPGAVSQLLEEVLAASRQRS